jgi:hypothetical protein
MTTIPCNDCITFALCKARLHDYSFVFYRPTAVRKLAIACSLLRDFITVIKVRKRRHKESLPFESISYIKIEEVIDYYDNYSV